jgi:hypothetical protein
MNPDGSGQAAVKNTGGGDQPTWSPDSTRIAYSGIYQSGTDPVSGLPIVADDIFVQPFDAGNATLPVNVTNDPQMSDRYPSWQPTMGSSQILYRRASAQLNGRELWRVDITNGIPGNLTVAETGSKGRAASWSPNGASAAFVSYVDGEGDLEIWLGTVNVLTNTITGARQLTNNAVTDDEPKMASVPVASSAVPPATGTPSGPTIGGGGPVGSGGPVGGGVVSGGGTTITVGGGTRSDGRRALSLTLAVPKQTLGRKKTLLGYARCNARCSVDVTGATKLKVGGKNRTLRLFRVKKTISANVRSRLTLRIPAKTLASVRGALRRKKLVKFSITATARTAEGEFTPPAVRTLTLRR